jgi:hypothetical protein
LLKVVCGGADVLLGVGGGLEKGRVVLQLLTALGIGGAQAGSFILQKLGGGESLVVELGRGGGGRGSRGASAG